MARALNRPVPLPLPVGSDQARTTLALDSRLVNAFAEKVMSVKGHGLSKYAVYGASGLSLVVEPVAAPCRGLFEADGLLYALHDQTLYQIDEDLAVTALGLVPGYDMVRWARNAADPYQIAIVCDAGVYKVEDGVVGLQFLPQIPGNVIDVLWLDGYFVLPIADGRWWISGINTFAVDALQFATAEGDPDGLVGVGKFKRELYLFGAKTTEVWANDGGSPFPFSRVPGAVLSTGAFARNSIVELDTGLVWIDDNRIVRKLGEGYAGRRISNQAVEGLLEGVEASQIEACQWSERGHLFYALTAPGFTWVYDDTMGAWHERQSRNMDRWQARGMAKWRGQTVVGSVASGGIYAIDSEMNAEGSEPMVTLLRLPPLDNFPAGAVVSTLDIDMETGTGSFDGLVGPAITWDNAEILWDTYQVTFDQTRLPPFYLAPGGVARPEMMLRWSDDGAKTWSDWQRKETGAQGDYGRFVKFSRLGAFGTKGRVHEMAISSPTFRAFVKASAVVEPRFD